MSALLTRAISIVAQAVAEDQVCNYGEAMMLYETACDTFEKAAQCGKFARNACRARDDTPDRN